MRFKTFILLLFIVFLIACQKKQTGPIISEYSDIYQVEGKWFCPLCNQEVKNGDRSQINPALQLSEWHDVYLDPNYFDKKINHISDEELINSIQFPQPFQYELIKFQQQNDWGNVFIKIKNYFDNRNDNDRLYHYDRATKIPFITRTEFIKQVNLEKDRRSTIIKTAESIVQPDSGFTIANHFFGKTVDWNFDWPSRSEFGVHYCYFFTDILNAYLVSEDEHLAESFEILFNQWYDQKDLVEHKMRPEEFKRRNVIWYELGLGNRTPRIIDSYRVHRKNLSPETHKRILKIILGSARWLHECLLKTPFHPYNWQTQTAMTLSYIALLFPEFEESEQWLATSRKNMEQHFRKDVYDDGGYVERTGSYTNYVFGMFYRYVRMFQFFADDNSYVKTVLPRLEKLMEFTALTMTPIGVNSPFNDCSRGTDLADLLIEMGEFFNRSDFLGSVESHISPEKSATLKVQPKEPEITSVDFEHSRYMVMRDQWNPNAYFLMLNYGPLQNHGHYDILSFEIFANGIPIAVDPGLGLAGYTDPFHVSWYKQSRSHNMLTIDDAVVNKRNIFGEEKIWAPQNYTDYFAASHSGYEEFHDTICRRHVVFVKGEYWLIVDEVSTPHKNKQMDFNFHSPLTMNQITNGFISNEEPGAFVTSIEDSDIKFFKKSGRADLRGIPGKEPNREVDWLIFRKQSKANAEEDRFAILVFPFATSFNKENFVFEKMELNETGLYGYRLFFRNYEDWLILSDGKIHQFSNQLSGDFVFGWFRWQEGNLKKLCVANVSNINVTGILSETFDEKTNFEKEF